MAIAYRSVKFITDRWSGITWDFYLSERTAKTIIVTLDLFLNLYEAQYHVRPKVIECDGELTKSNDIRKYVEVNKRMRLEPSAPGTQSQNGGAERAGALIKAKARAGAKLPAYLWKEIYQAAVYVGTCTTEPPSTCTGGPLLTTVFIPIWPTEMASWWKTGARNKGICEYTGARHLR